MQDSSDCFEKNEENDESINGRFGKTGKPWYIGAKASNVDNKIENGIEAKWEDKTGDEVE